MTDVARLIEENNPDPLLHYINELCNRQNWDEIVELANRCRAAIDRGKTLWGVEQHAYYRLALEAPGEFAALAIETEPGAMPLGPLSEVAASTHTWNELAPHLQHGPLYGLTAYECVALGEDLSENTELAPYVEAFELPLRLMPWEPDAYPRPEYIEDDVITDTPIVNALHAGDLEVDRQARNLDEPRAFDTWRGLVTPWISQSNGAAKIACVNGNAGTAISRVDDHPEVFSKLRRSEDVIRFLGWTAASGGAHGRRRGLAFGRMQTWLVLAETCGLLDDGTLPPPDVLGEAIRALEWFSWGGTHSGAWELRLAVHDLLDNVSFAINAYDLSEAGQIG